MNRVFAVATCGLLLAGCESLTSFQLPSFGGGKGSEAITLKLESDPAGAEAKLSSGASCVTPCALPIVPGGNIEVNFSLARYQPRSMTVRVIPAEKNIIGMESAAARLEPNPVYAELQPAAAAKKPRAKRPSLGMRPAPASASQTTPAEPASPAPAAPAAAAPAPAAPAAPDAR
jgi:PEGA domain